MVIQTKLTIAFGFENVSCQIIFKFHNLEKSFVKPPYTVSDLNKLLRFMKTRGQKSDRKRDLCS